ncbi:thioesterase-like superfamily-domain-containing protein [Hyaloraphidium curvatum]|nr:thioesterase-like superfamily-domain-containing protein [Hyaloraphidium curvatum]
MDVQEASNAAPAEPFILDRDSAVERVSRTETSALYALTLSDDLRIGEVPHGGYVLVVLLSAVADFFADRHPDPTTVSGFYLKPTSRNTPARVAVELIKAGRQYSVARAMLSQPDSDGSWTDRTMCIATFGDLEKESGPTRLLDISNPVAPRARCVRFDEPERKDTRMMVPFMRLLEDKVGDPDCPFPTPFNSTGRAESRVWIRSKDGRPVDWKTLVIQADATPVLFGYGLEFLTGGAQAWFPTVELSISFKARPSKGTSWLAQAVKCRALVNGRHENDVELYEEGPDGQDRLLAIAREIALVVPATWNLKRAERRAKL